MFFSRSKFIIAACVIGFFFIIVIGRLLFLQVIRGGDYARFSEAYTVKEIPIPAPRGLLFDRKGRLLASTRPAFNLLLSLHKVKDLDRLLADLSPWVGFSPEELRQKIKSESRDLPRFRPLVLMSDLQRDLVAKIQMAQSLALANPQEKSDWGALELRVEPIRRYEEGESFGHLFGYLREINDEKLKQMEKLYPGEYSAGDQVGAQGLERRFDRELRGKEGGKEAIVDALGHEVTHDAFGLRDELKFTPPVAGKNLYLTIDLDLQRAAFEALKGKEGAVVVLNVKTGEILALMSQPSYDSERLIGEVSRSYWVELNQDERKILMNRTIQAAYPPGSTFKIITGLAGLAERVVDPTETISCPGYYSFGGRRFGCWTSKGHGAVDFYRALVQSCDVYFYRVGERLGVDRLARYAKLFGLGETTGVELDFERSGLIPSSEWKKRVKKEDWNPGETLSVAIGQGYDLVTPLQNALMMARVASLGLELRPYLVKEMEFPDGRREKMVPPAAEPMKIGLEPEHWKILLKALDGVVQDPGGTAHRIALKGIQFGGKTGTAQVVSYDKFGRKARSKKTEDHAWFVAYAPSEAPEIALAVVVEHGGHGGAAAAPVAQAVIKKYFEEYHGYGKEKAVARQ